MSRDSTACGSAHVDRRHRPRGRALPPARPRHARRQAGSPPASGARGRPAASPREPPPGAAAQRGSVYVRDGDIVFVCLEDKPRGELLVVTLWEEGEDPAVPRRFTDVAQARRAPTALARPWPRWLTTAMGFLDKAKKMAEQAQAKLDEAQEQFNSASRAAAPGGGRGRVRQARPPDPAAAPAAATPPHGDPLAGTATAPPAPPPRRPACRRPARATRSAPPPAPAPPPVAQPGVPPAAAPPAPPPAPRPPPPRRPRAAAAERPRPGRRRPRTATAELRAAEAVERRPARRLSPPCRHLPHAAGGSRAACETVRHAPVRRSAHGHGHAVPRRRQRQRGRRRGDGRHLLANG